MSDITVDLWQDFEFATLNTTNLAANDHVSGGTWTITDAGSRLSTTSSAEKVSTGLIGGNSDSGGALGLRYESPNDFEAGHITYAYASTHSTLSFGFWFKFPAEYVGSFEGGQPDALYVENALGTNELYVKLVDGISASNQSSLLLFTAEAGESGTIDVEPDTWYWVTAVYGSTHKLRVYDDTGALVGSEQTRTGSAQASTQANLGNLIGDEGGGGPFDFDDWVMDWADATFPLGPPLASGTTDQEGFRWGIDDNNEASHGWEASQDTNITIADNQSRLLRVLVDATDDPDSLAYTLRYQKNGSGGYAALNVGSTTKITPVIETTDATNSGNNTASGSWAVSHPAASTGDLLIFCISWDDSTATTDVTEPAGPNSEVLSEVNATPATDSGTTVRCKVWYTVATGSWSASTRTFTPSASEQWTASVIKIPAGEFDATPIGASDTEGVTGTGANVQHGSFTAGGSDGSGKLCVWTATDANPQTVASGFSQVANVDRGAVAGGFFTRDTAVSNSESFSATTVSTQTAAGWATVAFVVRAPTITNEVYVTSSANIAGGGEATTARLTAPSGKTTSDFTTGRRWDDENGSDSIDIAADFYTELEWLVFIASSAANDDFFDFRVYAGANALDSYTVTPRWTIGTGSDIAAAGSLSIVGAADLDATGSLAAAGALSIAGSADVDARGSLAAAGSLSISGSAALAAGTNNDIAAAGTLSVTGSADLDATGSLAAAGSLSISGVADLDALGNLAAVGALSISGAADLDARGSLAAAGAIVISGNAELTEAGNPNMIAAGALSISGSALISAPGRLAASGALAVDGAASLKGSGVLQAVGSLVIAGSADLDARGSLSAAGQIAIFGAALLVDANAAIGYLLGTASVRPALGADVGFLPGLNAAPRIRTALNGQVSVTPED